MYGLTVIAPAGGVTAGQLVIVGAIVGVAACDAAAGAQVEVSPEGVFDLAKTPADALAAGAVAKVTVTNGVGVVGVAGTAGIGCGWSPLPLPAVRRPGFGSRPPWRHADRDGSAAGA